MVYKAIKGLVYIFMRLCFRLQVVDKHYVPTSGPVILCANHKSVLDPFTVGSPLPRKPWFMAKAELFVPGFKQLITFLGAFPVKRGGVSKESIRMALQVLRDGQLLCIFPGGTRSDDVGIGKKGAASFAVKSGAVVIPAAIIGDYKLFQRIRVVYGPPVDLSNLPGESATEQMEQATERIMDAIRILMDRR